MCDLLKNPVISTCANMTFADKSRYDRTFQQVTHKGWGSAMNCIKIFKNAQDLSVPVRNTYSEDQLMHTFLDNLEVLHRFLYTGKLSQMRGNNSGAGADPHPV